MKKFDAETGTLTDMTEEEIAERAAVTAKYDQLKADAEAVEAQKQIDAAAGNQKLLDLGLTQAEATALTGYTPPEE